MLRFYYRTFARMCLLPYIGGTVLHALRLLYDAPLTKIPNWIDGFIVFVGCYCIPGLVVFRKHLPLHLIGNRIPHILLILHLGGSVLLHAYILGVGSHTVLQVFPSWYSAIAVGYFIALGLYVLRVNKVLYGGVQVREAKD